MDAKVAALVAMEMAEGRFLRTQNSAPSDIHAGLHQIRYQVVFIPLPKRGEPDMKIKEMQSALLLWIGE